MKKSTIALSALGFVFAIACGDKDGGGDPPAVDPNKRTFSIEVRDEAGAALENATILLDLAGSTESGKSVLGRAEFVIDKELRAANVHVFHAEHRFTSIYGFELAGDADAAVIVLEPAIDPPAPMFGVAHASGAVRGWELLAPNTPDRARIARVVSIGEVEELTQAPRPGTVTPGNADGTEHNLVVNGESPFPQWTDYGLDLDARTETLAVFAGTFTVGDEPVLEYSHVGIRTGMKAVAEQELVDQDIEITHALDQRLEAIAAEVPRLATRLARFGVELGGGDVLPLGELDLQNGAARVYAPSLSDVFADATYVASVEARGANTEVVATMRGKSTSFTFAPLLDPVGEPTAAGRTLAASPSRGATTHVYTLRDDARGLTLWTVTLPGDEVRSIDLPDVPAGFADPLRGRLTLTVTAYADDQIARTSAAVDL